MRRFVWASGMQVSVLLTLSVLGAQPAIGQVVEGQGVWSEVAQITHARNELFGGVVDGKFYAFGGFDGEAYESDHVEVYDPVEDSWTELSPMLEGANHAGIAVLGDNIYFAGGFRARQHNDEKDSFIVFRPTSNQWERLAPLPLPRGALSLAGVDGKIHAIGGRRMDTVLAEHDVYDTATGQWTQAAPLPRARDHAGVAVLNGRIHVVGGRLGATEDNIDWHDIYDPQTDSWVSAPPIPTARSAGAYAVYKGLVFYLGGECRLDDTNFDEVEAFDPASNAWRIFDPLPVPLHGQAAGAIGDHLYMTSGSDPCGSGDRKNETWVFTLP
jgi:N-acetylneuraminic acid mutarotase